MVEKITNLKVIGAGFGRTGTLSLKTALEELGFGPCHHMTEVFNNPWQIPFWQAAIDEKPVDWHMLLSGYQSTTDWPCCSFYEQLMQAYPNAKVILSVRDPEKWYESASATIYRVSTLSRTPVFPLIALTNSMVRKRLQSVRIVNDLVWKKTFQDNFADKEYAIGVFNQHNEEVKQRVPADKLLVYNVKEGWEPLCAFLGVDVPNTPFPHVNDRENFGGNRMRQIRQSSTRTLTGAGIIAVLVLLIALLVGRKKPSDQ